ncbi:MAG: hypothetical protein ACI4OL_08670 [Gemmiger sp.]
MPDRTTKIDVSLGTAAPARTRLPCPGAEEVFAMVNRHHEEVKRLHRQALENANSHPDRR